MSTIKLQNNPQKGKMEILRNCYWKTKAGADTSPRQYAVKGGLEARLMRFKASVLAKLTRAP